MRRKMKTTTTTPLDAALHASSLEPRHGAERVECFATMNGSGPKRVGYVRTMTDGRVLLVGLPTGFAMKLARELGARGVRYATEVPVR